MDFLNNPHAHALQKTMVDAQQVLQEAHEQYQRAFDLARDNKESNTNGALSFRRAGRDYAQAVTRFSDAAMAWFRYADAQFLATARGKATSD